MAETRGKARTPPKASPLPEEALQPKLKFQDAAHTPGLCTGGHVGDESLLLGRVDDDFERTGSIQDLATAAAQDVQSVWTPFSSGGKRFVPLLGPEHEQCDEEDAAHADPWMSIAMNTKRRDHTETHHKVMLCKEGHTLTEVSTMCDVCYGRGPNKEDTTATAPVFFCQECVLILCDACCTNVACVLNHPKQIIRLQLLCDVCSYTSPFGTEKRRDPMRKGIFITEKHFKERKKYDPKLWDTAEVYKPRARSFYGCRSCDYDICSKCALKRLDDYKNISGSVVVRGSRVHILSFRVDETRKETGLSQLVNQARVAVPAVLNFLCLRKSTRRACLYFGRYDAFGNTVGIRCESRQGTAESIRDFSEHLRSDLLRVLMHDIWPPLRVDTPSQSKPLKYVLSSDMQALVWIKAVGTGAVYAKIVLQNIPYLYFDNITAGEDKYRWKNRCLHVRHLDNLETEKAVSSYETYYNSLQNSCAWARHMYDKKNSAFYIRHIKNSSVQIAGRNGDHRAPNGVPASPPDSPADAPLYPYSFAERLYENEDAGLDYKSYWVDPMSELLANIPKFMAGFGNAYGTGKLLVGVFEVHRRELLRFTEEPKAPTGDEPRFMRSWAEKGDTYPRAEWLEYHGGEDRVALVLGLALSRKDLNSLVKSISSSLRSFIPPMPPGWITFKLHPVKPPALWRGPDNKWVSVLLSSPGGFSSERTVNSLRALAHRSLRALLPFGLALVPMVDTRKPIDGHSTLCYVVVRGDAAQAAPQCFTASYLKQFAHLGQWDDPPKPHWRVRLEGALRGANASVVDLDKPPKVPPLSVLEVRINRDDTILPPRPGAKKPMFFTGWPSIPMWDEVNDVVAKIPKDLMLLERKRVKPTTKHWLYDYNVLQRVCLCLSPANTVSCGSWKVLMRLSGVSKFFSQTIMQTVGVHAFDWPATENPETCSVAANRLPIPHSVLSAVKGMPAVWKFFFARAGDIPMPHPYLSVPPSSSVRQMSLLDTDVPRTVVPVLKKLSEPFVERTSMFMCVVSASLYIIEGGTLHPVTGVRLRPRAAMSPDVKGVRDDVPEVGGFEFVSAEGDATWNLAFFMQWYKSVATDPRVGLTYLPDCGTMCVDPLAQVDQRVTSLVDVAEDALSCPKDLDTPCLCADHMPEGCDKEGVQRVGPDECDWHMLEAKWVRNKDKHWRD